MKDYKYISKPLSDLSSCVKGRVLLFLSSQVAGSLSWCSANTREEIFPLALSSPSEFILNIGYFSESNAPNCWRVCFRRFSLWFHFKEECFLHGYSSSTEIDPISSLHCLLPVTSRGHLRILTKVCYPFWFQRSHFGQVVSSWSGPLLPPRQAFGYPIQKLSINTSYRPIWPSVAFH